MRLLFNKKNKKKIMLSLTPTSNLIVVEFSINVVLSDHKPTKNDRCFLFTILYYVYKLVYLDLVLCDMSYMIALKSCQLFIENFVIN